MAEALCLCSEKAQCTGCWLLYHTWVKENSCSGMRTPEIKRRREREIRELSQGKRLIHDKCGSMRVKKLVFETISTKETQTLIPVNSDDRGQCWGMYNTPYLGAGQQKGKQLPLMYN